MLITLPATGIRSIDWQQPDPLVFVVRNGWTGAQTVGDLGGVRTGWQAHVDLAMGDVSRDATWGRFFAQARGPRHTFKVPASDGIQSGPAAATWSAVNAAVQNLLLWSNVASNAAWANDNLTPTVGSLADPSGGNVVSILTETTGTGFHRNYQGYSPNPGSRFTSSRFVKYTGTRAWVKLAADNSGASANFNIHTGAIGTITSVGAQATTAAITDAGNGWWRISIMFNCTTGTNPYAELRLCTGNNVDSYTGATSNSVAVYGAQAEYGPFATPYLENGATRLTRLDAFFVSGLPANSTQMTAGQRITLNDRLYTLTQDVYADTLGNSTVSIAPDFLARPATGDTVWVQQPYCRMRMVNPASGFTSGLNVYTPSAFDCEEAL